LILKGDRAAIHAVIIEWLSQRFQTTVISPSPYASQPPLHDKDGDASYIHAVTLTAFWGFVDDTGVRISPLNMTHSQVELMGQLRLGRNDFGVNKARIHELYHYLLRREES
jgi:uncharacterized protein (DUF1499 family)